MLIASQQDNSSAEQLITTSEKGDIATCLRANSALNATDNTILEYAKESKAT